MCLNCQWPMKKTYHASHPPNSSISHFPTIGLLIRAGMYARKLRVPEAASGRWWLLMARTERVSGEENSTSQCRRGSANLAVLAVAVLKTLTLRGGPMRGLRVLAVGWAVVSRGAWEARAAAQVQKQLVADHRSKGPRQLRRFRQRGCCFE